MPRRTRPTRRTRRTLLVTALVAALGPAVIAGGPASAVDQDLVVSVANGVPGTEVTVSSASCTAGGDGFAYLEARLISGTAPDEVLAGAANGYDDEAAILIVPDWADPAQPAAIEAACIQVDFSGPDPTFTSTPYDPVPFDIEPGAGAPVQSRTFSRTSLLAGQAFAVTGTGCFLPGANYLGIDVVEASDLAGRDMGEYVGGGGGDLDGQDFEGTGLMANSGWSIGISQTDDEPPVVSEIEEIPTDIAPGQYLALVYCGDDQGSILLFEPQFIEVTGDAPFGDVDLTVPAETRDVLLAGGSCTEGPVEATLEATDIDQTFGSGDFARVAPGAVVASDRHFGSGLVRPADGTATASTAGTLYGPRHHRRALIDDGYLDTQVDPDPTGDWAVSDVVDFDNGVVFGWAVCGDPVADGFVYDDQVAAVSVTPEPEVVPPVAPPAPPADVVQGSPNYTG